MHYWLMKSEPGSWSWDDQVKCGDDGAEWDGVRNHLADRFYAEPVPRQDWEPLGGEVGWRLICETKRVGGMLSA